MALVLAAAGLFIYLRLESQLNESIDNGLRSRAGDVVTLVEGASGGLGRASKRSLIEHDESFAQVLTPQGKVVDSTTQLEDQPVLDPPQLAQATDEPAF